MNDETLDRDVREAIEPDAGTVDRLVRGALHQDRPRGSVRGPVAVTAGAVLLVVGTVLMLNHDTTPIVPPQMRMMNVGETIVVKPISGGVWLIGAEDADADQLPAGTIIVYRSGARR
jgi:hypothetical protein